jgi:uncharacterized NAD(P)/FAD-binding protein YdhS
MSRVTSVAIIGLGSRGLSVLERIVALAKLAGPAAGEIRVEVIDPQCDGAGTHDLGQPDYLLLNTTAALVSMFPDPATVDVDVDAPGLTLYQWATERGLRLGADGFTVGAGGRPIRPTDFLPRRVLGEYLGWFLHEVLARAPGHVRIRMHHADAIDIASEPDDTLSITLSDGSVVPAQHAFLTTGYTANVGRSPAREGLITTPYPLPERLAAVRPGQAVAIAGFGLAAMDVVSCLTVGRGGGFIGSGLDLAYRASGQEPTISLFSRTGAPCRARPLVVAFGARYEPIVFTRAAIDRLREVHGGRLDFRAHVLPLILTEMRVAYRRCAARRSGRDAERALARALGTVATPGQIEVVLDELDRRHGAFDALAAYDTTTAMALADRAAYQDWVTGVMRADLAEGRLGFAGSPVKAAVDILRDLRDIVRYAVDFGGLADASLEEFHRDTVPTMNRAVVGPQFERHSELLALIAAGLVRVPFGPAPELAWRPEARRWRVSSTRLDEPYADDVDWIVSAHVSMPTVVASDSALLRALYQGGWIRPYRRGSEQVVGIDIDRDQHPIRADGHPDRRLWALGPLCEGATFYNNLVPSPGGFCRPVFDAHRCVAAMFAASPSSAAPVAVVADAI